MYAYGDDVSLEITINSVHCHIYRIRQRLRYGHEPINYIESVRSIGEVKAVIEIFKELGESIEIKNAVGVAYIRLREYDKAQGILETALGEAQTEEQQACILTNLAAINSLTGFHEEAYDFK